LHFIDAEKQQVLVQKAHRKINKSPFGNRTSATLFFWIMFLELHDANLAQRRKETKIQPLMDRDA
jgi:hypothetical protein